jgi:GMP synthase (glutamine-hydrolysing)
VRILSLIHEDEAPSGVFGELARATGHELVERNVTREGVPAPHGFDALMVFGGAMHVDQEDRHPWLREEDALLRALLERGTPLLGVCLGSQLIAKAAGARVGPAPRREIGWHEVELTPEAAGDPVLGALPGRFRTFQWHSYAFGLPPGAVPLAENPVCLQAYRIADSAWGIQFHAEVTREIVERWLASVDGREEAQDLDFSPMPGWNELGRGLAARFLAAASSR